MNWYKLASAMSVPEALKVFGLPAIPQTEQEIKSRRNQLAREHHPDRGGATAMMQAVNAAYETLSRNVGKSYQTSNDPEVDDYMRRYRPSGGKQPEWQTDERSSNNNIGKNWKDANRCKVDIYEEAIEKGPVKPMDFETFDGYHFREGLTAMCNEASLGFAGEVVDYWVRLGGNSHDNKAVFVNLGGNTVKMIRLFGEDVSNQNIVFEHDSINQNAGNDSQFVYKMRKYIEDAYNGMKA